MKPRILFLSGLDFKERSIQVIRITPEAYVKAGWEVDYVVARDNLEEGNYSYEREFNPEGVNVIRRYWPAAKLRARVPRHLSLIISKIASALVVIKITHQASKLLRRKNYEVVYGYELQGVLAMQVLAVFLRSRLSKKIARFQGTFLNEMFEKRQIFRTLFNLDLIIAMRAPNDLLIMTDDGTQGNQALKRILPPKQLKQVRFWTNGVADSSYEICRSEDYADRPVSFLSVSRLVGWKRVDRCLHMIAHLKQAGFSNVSYTVVGDGEQKQRLSELARSLGISPNVQFVGSVKQDEVASYMSHSDFFVSMYDGSNVGNPLLEAIRANTIIVTLNNGDTARWIKHKINGLIYDPSTDFYVQAASDIIGLIENPDARNDIRQNLRKTEKDLLWTWEERMETEILEVTKCCE